MQGYARLRGTRRNGEPSVPAPPVEFVIWNHLHCMWRTRSPGVVCTKSCFLRSSRLNPIVSQANKSPLLPQPGCAAHSCAERTCQKLPSSMRTRTYLFFPRPRNRTWIGPQISPYIPCLQATIWLFDDSLTIVGLLSLSRALLSEVGFKLREAVVL